MALQQSMELGTRGLQYAPGAQVAVVFGDQLDDVRALLSRPSGQVTAAGGAGPTRVHWPTSTTWGCAAGWASR